MAYQLANYITESGISLLAAYLRITKVIIEHENNDAVVSFSIFADAAAATSGKVPIKTDGYEFEGDLYNENFCVVPGVDPLGTQPTNVNDIIQCQAYLAMKNHSSLVTLLTGAIAV